MKKRRNTKCFFAKLFVGILFLSIVAPLALCPVSASAKNTPSVKDMQNTIDSARKSKDSKKDTDSGKKKSTVKDAVTKNANSSSTSDFQKYGHSKETAGNTGTTGIAGSGKKTTDSNKKTGSGKSGASKSSWLYGHTDDSIYGNGDSAVTISDEDEKQSKPGVVAGLFIDFIDDIANWCHSKMESIGMSLDSIVLGRVGGHGVAWNGYRVSLFTFEMRPGNPYGVVASAVYNTIRGIIYIVITLIVLAKLVMAAYAGGSTKALAALKESLSSYLIAILMLTLMPYLFDVLLYIRDVILYAVTSKLGADILHLDVSKLSIIDMFKDIASDSVMNASMYLGTVLLTLWFAMTYISLALGFIIYFFAFPFVCMNMQFDKNTLGEWWKQMVYSMLIPISDIVLLFIPLAFSSLGDTAAIHTLQFLVCTMLIPARAQLRNAMGIRTNMGMELAGIATVMGAAAFARSAVGTTARVGAGLFGAASDRRMGKMYSEMAANENAQKNEFADMYNQENGYGKHGGIVGAKEVSGVDSLSSGIAGLSNSYGIPVGALDDNDSFNNDPAHLSADVGRGGIGGRGGMGMGQSQDVLEKYANMSNFENPEFNGISAEKKAELYKQRSRRRFAQAATTAVGGVVGAGVGLGASTFFSPGTKAQMAGLGMSMGAGVGATVPSAASVVGKGITAAGKGIAAAGRTAYDLGAYSHVLSDLHRLQNNSDIAVGNEYTEEAETQFVSNMDAINAGTQQAMNLNGYLDQATSPDNEELASYMDQAYAEIMGDPKSFANISEMRNAMSQKCVEHVLMQAEPYYASNIQGMENADADVINKIIGDNKRLAARRVNMDLSPENISKYGNGKYTFH